MIEVRCNCAKPRMLREVAVGKRFQCPACGQVVQIVSGEALTDGAGLGDFDTALVGAHGSLSLVGKYLLGGVAEIQVGKTHTNQIILAGVRISRHHCKLVRVDFGPSRWKIVDQQSTNGVFVNKKRVNGEQELKNGDAIQIGEFNFLYQTVAPAPAPAANVLVSAPVEVPLGGPVCPSCEKNLAPTAKICIDCGIRIPTGRPLLTRQGFDENYVYAAAYQWIQLISFVIRITPMPIPIRSEAYGGKKPYAIWTIAIFTTIVSVFFYAYRGMGFDDLDFARPGTELMLFSPWSPPDPANLPPAEVARVRLMALRMGDAEREKLRDKFDPAGRLSDENLLLAAVRSARVAMHGDFHWYQLFTHAFLHDTGSVMGFLTHLGGNMLFMLVFGTRVNALLGDLATAILYPILIVFAAGAYILAMGDRAVGPMVGASGAIMGLAGMYLILFPVHKVICAMWIRLGILFRAALGCKIFAIRGFWVLLIYFAFDIVMNWIDSLTKSAGGVAHWAHIGGFTTGMILAVVVLLSRQFDTHGGDLLSVALGRHAWPLIGKPSQWIVRRQSIAIPEAALA